MLGGEMEVLYAKKITLLCTFLAMSIGSCSYLTATHHNDAMHEINQLANENQHKEDITEQVVLGNFANMVQNFFSIVQDPHNTAHVGANISQMLAGIVNVAVQVMKNFPVDASSQERAEFIKNIELSLTASLRALANAEKIL
jgi:hypothetical protein